MNPFGIVIEDRGAPTGVLIPEVVPDVRFRSNSETADVLSAGWKR